jgi:1-aminocyclopropane-1-carboxylate deaminase/D-cysteine desulfhydrase-like pyridoxal-dependent ACC family enzyme
LLADDLANQYRQQGRKLKYNVAAARQQNSTLLTFGGAYSTIAAIGHGAGQLLASKYELFGAMCRQPEPAARPGRG